MRFERGVPSIPVPEPHYCAIDKVGPAYAKMILGYTNRVTRLKPHLL